MTEANLRRGHTVQLCLSTSWGGLEQTVVEWSKRLGERERCGVCICRNGSPLHARLDADGLPFVSLPPGNRYFDPRAVHAIRSACDRSSIDFLMVHSSKDLWLAACAVDPRRTRILFFNHMINRTVRKTDPAHRLIHGKIEHVITLSRPAREGFLSTTSMPPGRVSIIPDAVDPERFRATEEESKEVRRRHHIPPDAFLVLTVGRIDPKKGQRELIDAVIDLSRRGLDLHLLIVGSRTRNEHEKYDSELRRLVDEARLGGRIVFAGERENVAPYYRAADLFVLPSYCETFGLVLLEAMLTGVPIVATDAGAVPEILDSGRCGRIVEPESPAAIGEAIRALHDDPALRRRLSEAASEKVHREYTAGRVTDTVLELMDRLGGGKAAAKPFGETVKSWFVSRRG